MQLLSLREFAFEPGDLVCRERRVGRVAALIAFSACAVGFFLVGLHVDQARKPALLVSLCCLLHVIVSAPAVWRAWRTNPWVVCVRQREIALNLRSCRNSDRSEEDRVVARFDWSEIRCARESSIELRLPNPDNWRDRRHRELYLVLEFNHSRTVDLAAALRREFGKIESLRIHYFAPTAELTSPNRIRIPWEDELRTLRPSLRDVLLWLTPYVPVEDSERDSIDWNQLDFEAREALMRARFRDGHHDQVVGLLRKQRGLKKADAEKLVSELAASTAEV